VPRGCGAGRKRLAPRRAGIIPSAVAAAPPWYHPHSPAGIPPGRKRALGAAVGNDRIMKSPNTYQASDNPFDDERPSKTQLKKASHELQALGEDLVGLPDSRIATLDLSETLLAAIKEYRRTKSHEGKRRQMQFIGKLMRHTDAEPIREAVAAMKLGVARNALELHEAERWRAELIASDDALTRWMAEFPATDAQELRSIVRAARKDAALVPEKRSGRAYRELFQLIKRYQAGDAGDAEPDQAHDEADDE
jgi:ribosome-associated protein